MSIHRCPSFLQGFFRPFRQQLTRPQFAHLWAYVLALVINLKDAKLIHLAAVTPRSGHRTRCGAFLGDSQWDPAPLVEQAAFSLLAALNPQPGEVVYLILDENRIAKRGKSMAYLSKIWDHKQQQFVRGHMVLTAAVLFRGVLLPWRIELWKPKGHSGPRYRKLTSMAAQMIREFPAPQGVKVRVLFDAFYLCPQVTRTCEKRGFSFFSVASKNRSFTREGKRSRKIAKLAPGLIRYQGRKVHLKRARRRAVLRIAHADGKLSKIGRVRMVISKRPRGPWKKLVAIVTNEINLKAREIVAIYELRWNIELLFKELRCDLGLGDYQVLAEEAIAKHLHLVCLAHLLLTHHSREGAGEQAKKTKDQVPAPTLQQRLENLRRQITRDQIEQIIKGPKHARLRKRLQEHLVSTG